VIAGGLSAAPPAKKLGRRLSGSVKRKSVAAAGITLLLGQAVLVLVGPVSAHMSRRSIMSTECGHERWVVKTLQDKPAGFKCLS
jgi:hypothetical protein